MRKWAIAGALAMAAGLSYGHAGVGGGVGADPVPAVTLAEAQKLIEARRGESRVLLPGDRAPAIQAAGWVQGESIETFEPGTVTVVEMWATWCGPCIPAVPHLDKLYREYTAQGVKLRVVGMNILDQEPGEAASALEGRIRKFIADRKGQMTYTVGYDREGKMVETWMEPAKRQGIPSSFVVDQEGRVAWIGHPMTIDEPLKKIIAKEWDLTAARAAYSAEAGGSSDLALASELVNRSILALAGAQGPAREEHYKVLEAVSLTLLKDLAAQRVQLALSVLDYAASEGFEADKDWAVRVSEAAVDSMAEPEAVPVALLANVYHLVGKGKRAVETMDKAIVLAESSGEPRLKELFVRDRAMFERSLGAGGGR